LTENAGEPASFSENLAARPESARKTRRPTDLLLPRMEEQGQDGADSEGGSKPEVKRVNGNNETSSERRLCQPEEASNLDLELEALVLPLTPGEEAAFLQKLDSRAYQDPVVVWEGRNIVVEGHGVVRHARARQAAFWVVETAFADRMAVVFHVLTRQLGRALSSLAKSYLRGQRYLLLKRQGARSDLVGGRMTVADPTAPTCGNTCHKLTADHLGVAFSTGGRTIRGDGRVARAVDGIVANGVGIANIDQVAELRNRLLAANSGVTQRLVLHLAGQEAEEQRQFLRQLIDKGKIHRQRLQKGVRPQKITIPLRVEAIVQALERYLEVEELVQVSEALLAPAG
jgi:hypothetical protein